MITEIICECGQPADGLDDEHCQDCWEKICSEGWWETVNAIAQVKGENHASTP